MYDIKDAKAKFKRHKDGAARRGIGFELTFDQWINMWIQSGKWEQRGNGRYDYVMSRKGDKGPYAIDNVVVKTRSENTTERNFTSPQKGTSHPQYGKPGFHTGILHKEETKKRISESMKRARAMKKESWGVK